MPQSDGYHLVFHLLPHACYNLIVSSHIAWFYCPLIHLGKVFRSPEEVSKGLLLHCVEGKAFCLDIFHNFSLVVGVHF
jgi:hypothetical protein